MKKYILLFISVLVFTSCSDFLDRYPQDSLSPATFWKTEKDAKLALIGCYNGFESGWTVICRDNTSDNGYNFHGHEGWQSIGNGTMSAGSPGNTEYGYTTIRKCNEFLENIVNTYMQQRVEFNSGEIGEIVLINRNRFSRPMVKCGDKFYDLATLPNLSITKIL